MKFKKLSLFLLGGLLLAGCSKAGAIELSVVPNQSMVTGKAIVIDVKSEPVVSINPNSIEISGGESWVENGVIKFKANEPGSYKMTVKQDDVTSNTITIDLGNTNAIAKNESQSTTSNKNSTSSSSTPKSSATNKPATTTPNQGQTSGGQSTPSTPQYTPTPSQPAVTYPSSGYQPDPIPAPTEPVAPVTPSIDPEPVVTPEPDPTPSTPQEDPTPAPAEPVVTPEAPVAPEPAPTPDPEEDPASTVQETTMNVDQVYSDQNQLIANKTPITVDGQLPTTLVTDNSGKKVQVLWNDQTSEYIILEGFTIPFGGCNAQASGTLSRNGNGQLVLKMTYISTDDIPAVGDTGEQDPLPEDTSNKGSDSVVDRNNPTPHPEPGTNS